VENTDSKTVSFSWIKLVPSKKLLALWDGVESRYFATLMGLGVQMRNVDTCVFPDEAMAHAVFARLLRNPTRGMSWQQLSVDKYVNGRWYDGGVRPDAESVKYRQRVKDAVGVPFVVQNNWIVGHSAQVRRAKAWGHWFADDDGSCGEDTALKEKLVASQETFATLKRPAATGAVSPNSLPNARFQLELDDFVAQRLVDTAKNMLERLEGPPGSKFLLVSGGSERFLSMYQSWYCNTAFMKGVHERTLVMMFSEEGAAALNKSSPGITTVAIQEDDLAENYEWQTCGYWRAAMRRLQLIGALVRAGVPLLLWEPDATWVQNPLLDSALLDESISVVTYIDNTEEDLAGFGWLKLVPNAKLVALWEVVEEVFVRNVNSKARKRKGHHKCWVRKDDTEQGIFSKLLVAAAGDVKWQQLSVDKYVNGRWYDGGVLGDIDAAEYRLKVKEAEGMPVVVQNNWVQGNDKKVGRAKAWGHWFAEDDGTCGEDVALKEKLSIALTTFSTLVKP
jgi:hypothetical protein